MEEPSKQESKPTLAERINVGLIKEAAEALARLQVRTGMKKVDLVNRSISVYEYFDAELRAGSHIYVRDSDGNEQRVMFF